MKSISIHIPDDAESTLKCVVFWYFIGIGYKAELKLVVTNGNHSDTLWVTEHTTDKWVYVQLPLVQRFLPRKVRSVHIILLSNEKWSVCFIRTCLCVSWTVRDTGVISIQLNNFTWLSVFNSYRQLTFQGMSKGPFLAIDDVSFTMESCQTIPWAPYKGRPAACWSIHVFCVVEMETNNDNAVLQERKVEILFHSLLGFIFALFSFQQFLISGFVKCVCFVYWNSWSAKLDFLLSPMDTCTAARLSSLHCPFLTCSVHPPVAALLRSAAGTPGRADSRLCHHGLDFLSVAISTEVWSIELDYLGWQRTIHRGLVPKPGKLSVASSGLRSAGQYHSRRYSRQSRAGLLGDRIRTSFSVEQRKMVLVRKTESKEPGHRGDSSHAPPV